MKFIDEYRDPELARKLVNKIHRKSTKPVRLMEFCGGHTVAVFRYGIRQLLPKTIEMLSGPGCPVCVTAGADLDKAIALARLPNVIIATFGDMVRVPGSYSSLADARAEGCDIRIVYSAYDALLIARKNPDKDVIFIAIGFEATAPTIAASILEADEAQIGNYYILPLNMLCPPIMKTLLELGEVRLDGIIAPGHVSCIIGSYPYRFIPQDFGVACVISGFEPLDILMSIYLLVRQIEIADYKVEIAYRRGVKPEGNIKAAGLLEQVFEVSTANWRGIGAVPSSGLRLNKKYKHYDANSNFSIEVGPPLEPEGCICGSILRGVEKPPDCKLFSGQCTPEHPVGPCMVSSEGSCAAYYHYRITYEE